MGTTIKVKAIIVALTVVFVLSTVALVTIRVLSPRTSMAFTTPEGMVNSYLAVSVFFVLSACPLIFAGIMWFVFLRHPSLLKAEQDY